MKNILYPLLILLLAGCGNRGGEVSKHVPGAIKDSLAIKKELGRILERNFSGKIPCADCPGILYELTLYNQEFSGDGVYDLKRTYIDAEHGRDVCSYEAGRWITLRGDNEDPDATVLQLSPGDSIYRQNLLYLTDSLVMLDRHFDRHQSHLNYTLQKIVKDTGKKNGKQ